LAGDGSAIVLGDCNANEESTEMKTLRGVEPPAVPRLVDSYRALHPQATDEERTFHGYQGGNEGARIDFVLHTDQFKTEAAAIDRTNYDGLWPSDHYPVTATLQIAPAE
jgi:endonuclease/exonuclease/phosphatase family metal-dependent hydrolase